MTSKDAAAPRPARPLVSMMLIAYNQEKLVGEAIRGELSQTYSPLEIVISDDCSTDGTFAAIEAALHGYAGPHRIVLNRNASNEGITAHLSRLARLSSGELLFVAAGDDISLPQRCERVVDCWLAHDRKVDLIATDVLDLDHEGNTHDVVPVGELGSYASFDDWLAEVPGVIGAAHAWSRRLFDRFGDMKPGAMAEDQIMAFRAIMTGGALTMREPLVLYRRGGLSGRRRWRSVDEFIVRTLRTNRFALAEIEQLQHDAQIVGEGARMRTYLAPKLAREVYTRDLFAARSLTSKAALLWRAQGVKLDFRLRMFLYAACPGVYAPFFALKGLRPG
jgi:glycosyltransferase involved in cell wall biosynthesis